MKNLSQKPPLWQLHKKHNCFSLIFGLTNPSGKPYSRKGRKGFSTLFQFIIAYSNTSNTNGEETGRRPVSMYMNSMDNNTFYSFSLEKPLSYVATGKFEAPSQEWMHLDRWLGEDFELMVVTNGTLYMGDDSGKFEVSTGEYLLIPPGSHQFGWRPSNIILIPKFANLPNVDRLVILMKQMQDSIRRYNSPVQNDYLATSVLCELNCQCFNPQKSRVDMKKQQMYNDIVDYVRWYLHTDIKVQDIARHFGYNEKYLSHLFSNVAGIPLKQYILQQKIEQAKFLLSDTNDSVQKISEKLGFGDSRNFMKIFKKIVGMTPTDYRNSSSHRILNYK